MSVLIGEAELKEQLLHTNEDYRRLAAEHQSYSDQLEKLSSRSHLSDEEKIQEVMLKKKKLLLKDQMYLMLQKHRKAIESGN
jgi:uncharacterized protein YdcH (DUF465 family)